MTSPERETSFNWSSVIGLMRKAMSASPEFDQTCRLLRVADVVDIAEAGDGVLIEAEELVENDLVQLGDSELALLGGEAFHQRSDVGGPGRQQVVAVAGRGNEGIAGRFVELRL